MINDVLEPLRVNSALRSEKLKLNYRNEHTPNEITILDYTIIKALEKQIPSKVEEGTEGGYDWYCSCGTYLSHIKDESIHYCKSCGQRLNWGDYEHNFDE